ncbi:YPDG domain-containing protein, partial [Brevibacterium sp. ACRRH]|uniref:YPDG domain-containing protein n=1 Tax=Brevibacterium sp. ACRRH TaxID=2918183 RepID=UPI001EF5F090
MDERVKGYTVSPVYKTTTRADGSYTVHFPTYKDVAGVEHKFTANPYQKLRVWIENPDADRFQVSFQEGDGVFKDSVNRYNSTWDVATNRVNEQNIALTERPQTWLSLPEAQRTESEAEQDRGNIKGRVFWDQQNYIGGGDVPSYNFAHGDVAIPKAKVIGSYLRDEVVNVLEKWKKDNPGYTREQFVQAQKDAIAKFETDNPGKSAIAETVTATTDAQGRYVLQFKGTYGVSSTNIGTLPNEEAKKLFHTVADSAAAGRWATSGGDVAQGVGAGKVSKHINRDYVYVYLETDESANVNPDNFRQAYFQDPAWDARYATKPEYGDIENSDFALKPSKPGFDVVDYNTTDKPAFKGTTVQTRTVGLVPNSPYTIQWYDAAGNKVGTKCDVTTDNFGAAKSCPLTVPDTAKAGDVYTAMVLLPDGTPYLADSFIVQDPIANSIDPEYEDKLVVPGEETKSSPTFTDDDDKDVKAPEGSKFAIPEGFEVPEGYEVSIDENTGEITVTFPDKSKLNKDTVEEFYVPVMVTYPDGSKDDAKAFFNLDTDGDGDPDVTDPDDDGDGIPDEDDSNPKVPNANDHFEPGYEDGSGKPGEDVKIDAPTFKDKDGKDTKAPEGTKFTPGEGAPEGVTIDENTGEITVPIPEDAKPGDKITVPVVVTYPDGTKDTVDVTVTVEEPDAEKPDWKDDKGKPGDKVEIPNEGGPVPDGSTVETEGPGKAEIDEDGNLIVDIDKDAKPGDKIEIVVKDKDGNEIDRVVVEVEEDPDAPKQADELEPEYKDGFGKPGTKAPIDAPTFTDKDGNKVTVPEGTKFSTDKDGVEVAEDGSLKVQIPETAKPGDKITVPVVVTYPDGTKDTVDVTVTVEEPDAEKPDWKDDKGKPGDKVEIPNEGGPVPDGSTVETEGPGKAEIDEDGNLIVDIDKDAKPGDKIEIVVKDKDGNEIDRVVVEVEEDPDAPKQADELEPEYKDGFGKPGTKAPIDAPTFTDKDGNKVTVPEGTKFSTDKDGVEVAEDGSLKVQIPETAKPGDKITVPVDVTYPDGSKDTVDVTVTVEKPDTPAPSEKDNEKFEPEYKDGFGKPGTKAPIDAPTFTDKDGNKVTVPEGTKFGTDKDGVEVAEDGSLKVQIPADAKPGDEIKVPVTVTYPDGSKDNVDVTVTVTDPDKKPEWGDDEGAPGDKVTVPNEGGDVPEGSTTEVEGPGKAEIDENGNLVVDIEEDAKPGDKIVVEVKDPEGNTIDESTVTVTEPPAPAEKDNEKFEPEYEDGSGKPGEDVKVEKPEFKDKDGKETKAPEGTKFTPGENAPEGVKVDENTGEITVPIPEDAKPGDKITVPVDVTYPDGSKDTVDVTVTVEKPDAPAEKPDWKDDKGKPGDKVEIPNTGGPVEDGTTVETEGPG